jgi:hypothetical protein
MRDGSRWNGGFIAGLPASRRGRLPDQVALGRIRSRPIIGFCADTRDQAVPSGLSGDPARWLEASRCLMGRIAPSNPGVRYDSWYSR